MCLLNRFFVITDTACPIFDLGYIFMRLFGYARVSTSQQSLDIQVRALKDASLLTRHRAVQAIGKGWTC